MTTATLAILLQIYGAEKVGEFLGSSQTKMGNMTQTLIAQRSVFRELAMGISHLGVTLLSVGVALQNSNNAIGKQIGQTLSMVGGWLTAISAGLQLVRSITMIIDALNKLKIAQIWAQALTPGIGWATLAAGVGIGVGTTALIASRDKTAPTANINTTVNLDGKKVGELVQRNLALKADQNYGTDRSKLFGR